MVPSKSPPLSELTGRQLQWIAGGAMMTLATMPGQTNFIAQFNTALRTEFGLSHGEFGGYYTLATLASASVLVFAGVLADRLPARRLAIICMLGLAATALFMAGAGHVAILVIALALLRFFGQGMLSHVAMTTMSRWFNRFRGRALSFAGLGYTIGDAFLPFVLTVSILAFGWRNVWAGAAAVLVGLVIPAIWFLLRDPPEGRKGRPVIANPDGMTTLEPTGLQWTRARVLRDPLFYVLLPGIMAPPAIGTLYIFHQAHLTEAKGWDLTTFTALFPFLSLSVAVSSIFAGFMVDRFGSWRLMPFVLLPLATASLVLGVAQPIWSMPFVFIGIGLTQGMMNPVVGALWVELYGTAHIGAIRSIATAALVAASALGPGIAGLLIDRGAVLPVQTFGYAAYCFLGSLAYLTLQGAMARRASGLQQPAE
ncbi:MAG: MFS transporter [Alphaproteobacteria bacterium]|nr:MFS transporter [Alphaproteobacteria bacterium]MBU1559725.1 MFS transporter [Alphaproteobacteria bacterium]MBU2305104.1 MFS transporter [Alphaproteobacteria bacterium]MBU2367909.1 MFS transporter [Alphaproteobacteria bacterium]